MDVSGQDRALPDRVDSRFGQGTGWELDTVPRREDVVVIHDLQGGPDADEPGIAGLQVCIRQQIGRRSARCPEQEVAGQGRMIFEMDSCFIHGRDPQAGKAGDPLFFKVPAYDRGDPGSVAGQQSLLRFHERDLDGRESFSPSRVHGEGQLHARRTASRDDDPQRSAVGPVAFLELVNPLQQQTERPGGYGVFPHARGVHAPGDRTDVDRKSIIVKGRTAVVEVNPLEDRIEAGHPDPDEPDARPVAQRPQFHFHLLGLVQVGEATGQHAGIADGGLVRNKRDADAARGLFHGQHADDLHVGMPAADQHEVFFKWVALVHDEFDFVSTRSRKRHDVRKV